MCLWGSSSRVTNAAVHLSLCESKRETETDGESGICEVDARQRDKAGKDVQQVRVIKGRDRNVQKSEASVYRR